MIVLHTRDGSKCSNAILYGDGGFSPLSHTPLFAIESDFGNKFSLTWAEIEEQYTIGYFRDYAQWRDGRSRLIRDGEITFFPKIPQRPEQL